MVLCQIPIQPGDAIDRCIIFYTHSRQVGYSRSLLSFCYVLLAIAIAIISPSDAWGEEDLRQQDLQLGDENSGA